jgi:UDP-glucose 4-epimerase
MKVFVVGATGYIGSNLVPHLVANGHVVQVGVRSVVSHANECRLLRYSTIDLLSPETYRHLLHDIDVICYLVGPGSAVRYQRVGALVQDYLLSLTRFLETNADVANARVVFASSGGTIYGAGDGTPFSEAASIGPISPYGQLNAMSESLLAHFRRRYSSPHVSLRISNPYGGVRSRRKSDQGVIDIFAKKALAAECVEVRGGGAAIRDYLFMDDLLDAFDAVLSIDAPPECLNIGSGVGTSLNQVIRLIESFSGSRLERVDRPRNELDIHYSVLDITRARHSLGWYPRVAIDEGISKVIRDLR